MGRAHDPSGLGGRWPGLCRHPQYQAGRARDLRGQRQLSAGDKVELSRLAPDLQHDGADRIAGKRVRSRPQRVVHVSGANGNEKARIKTEFGKSAHRDGARFNFREILPDPDQGPSFGDSPCEPRDKAGRHSALPAGLRKHLVNGAQRKPALQARVRLRMTEQPPARWISLITRLEALDAAA